jgi:predicted transcriptional regulator
MSYKLEVMMQSTLTVRVSASEAQSLDGLCAATGKSRSEVVREALRSYSLRESLRQSQAQLAPLARAAGWLTEDDVLNEVS